MGLSEVIHYAAAAAAAAAKSLQLCPTLFDPRDGSPPGSPVPGILQTRTVEWVATSFSNAWKWKVKVKLLSRVRLLAIPRTAAYQAPPAMGFWNSLCFQLFATINSTARNTSGPGAYGLILFQYDTGGSGMARSF